MIFYTFQLSSKFRHIPVVPVPLVLALHIVPISNFKCFPFVFARPLLLHLLCKASTQHLTFDQNTSSLVFLFLSSVLAPGGDLRTSQTSVVSPLPQILPDFAVPSMDPENRPLVEILFHPLVLFLQSTVLPQPTFWGEPLDKCTKPNELTETNF